MSAPEIYSLATVPITSHAFSADRSQVAVSFNSEEAQILARQGAEWIPVETLAEHDKVITSIDWAPKTNRIVTCSQDRNAYVWTETPNPVTGEIKWKPTLVLLRINRAATFVRWSPFEDKFAVASGARAIAICSFESDNDWWVAKHLKKPIRSTVLSVEWHPNNVLLASGSADMKARVLSAYIKDVDKRPSATVWGEKLPFNTLCGEYSSPNGGWVHSVGFSPSGDVLAFASHDSCVTIVYPGPTPTIFTVKMNSLPYVTLTWTAEDTLVAAGHDCHPMLFQADASGWKAVGSLDDVTGSSRSASGFSSPATPSFPGRSSTPVGRLNNEAFNRFRNADTRGTSGSAALQAGLGGASGPDGELLTVHQNTITSVRPYDYAPDGTVAKVTTTGVDGKLVVWAVSATPGSLAGKLGNVHLRH